MKIITDKRRLANDALIKDNPEHPHARLILARRKAAARFYRNHLNAIKTRSRGIREHLNGIARNNLNLYPERREAQQARCKARYHIKIKPAYNFQMRKTLQAIRQNKRIAKDHHDKHGMRSIIATLPTSYPVAIDFSKINRLPTP